jgi:hypothetical protein
MCERGPGQQPPTSPGSHSIRSKVVAGRHPAMVADAVEEALAGLAVSPAITVQR